METTKAYPTTIYAEMTPNPATMKFVANRLMIQHDAVAEFMTKAEAKGFSPLAEQLFQFPFVKSVFIAVNFVTITKNDSIGWEYVTMELREFVSDYLRNNEWAVTEIPPVKKDEKPVNTVQLINPDSLSEIDKKIMGILDEFVRPAVENDGGAIHYKSFDEGKVSVILRGSCSGCPSSQATLKQGIETLLKQMMPEVTEVVAEEV
jgi:Fe-S cluster biogenesis protein NfuA